MYLSTVWALSLGDFDTVMQNDIGGLLSQLKDMQQRNAELEEANKEFTSSVS